MPGTGFRGGSPYDHPVIRHRKTVLAAVAIALGAVVIFLPVIPGQTESTLNRTVNRPPYRASARAAELHRTLVIADLHTDTLLWDRDLLMRGRLGHVDVPRLVEGNTAVQAFTVVTKVPRGMNIDRNDGNSDAVLPLVIAQWWPPRTWWSLKERALHQARRLDGAAARSGGTLSVVRTATDLRNHLDRRRTHPGTTAGFLGIEGAQALEAGAEDLDVMFDAGFRMMSFTHFFDTFAGGSASGEAKTGLTEAGLAVLRRMEARGMIVDLAHASAALVDDILAAATRPVVVSHTGVTATCDNNRNLTDAQLRRIAANGGIVGIGYFEAAVCEISAASIARAIRHTADVAGIEHVALGSDFDGATVTPFDASGLVLITEALLAEGFSEQEIRQIMGGNVVSLLLRLLPR